MGILKTIGKAISSVASPLISGVFGIGSTALNNKAQKEANETNMQIAQMNNQWSEKMMEKQHLYDIEMMNRNNEYNSASAQVQRLKDAGLNPSMAMNGGASSGISQGGNSVGLPSPSSSSVLPMRYEGFANAINSSIQMTMALDRHNSEMDALGRNTAMNLALARAKIAQMYEQTRGIKFKNELNDITKDLQLGMANEDFLKRINERYLVGEQEKLVKQQIIAQDLINQNLPDKLSMEVAVLASQRDLNKHNSQSEVGKIIETLQKRGYKLSKQQKDTIFKAVIQDIETQQYRGLNATNTIVGLLNRD